jgi:beta-galactosidase
MFRDDPQLNIIGHWTYPADTKKTVYVVSNGEEVELLLNDQSLGRVNPIDRFLFAFTNISWQPGELKAVAFIRGKMVASQSKRTTGRPVALRLTSMTGPDGLRADGSDIALFDVEAVDAHGERCPTFQKRVDFETTGSAAWRGGYNSGRTNSINCTSLELECGINRVALRAGRSDGEITLSARCEGLSPARVSLQSKPAQIEDGFSTMLPSIPVVSLPKTRLPGYISVNLPPSKAVQSQSSGGRYTKSFSYSGPTATVHLEPNVQSQKSVYLDRPYSFKKLPGELIGADWVQTANADKFFPAMDLMEISVESGTVVSVAHDDRLPRPGWLIRLFQPTNLSLEIEGQPMRIFQRRTKASESLTLGANIENSKMQACNMYVVFIAPPSQTSAGARTARLR